MTLLESWIAPHQSLLVAALAAAVACLALAALAQGIALRRVRAKWRSLLDGAAGGNLERMLYDHLRERVALEERVAAHGDRLDQAERRLRIAKSYVGVVRFDAFPDVGGQQSFSLAIYDDQGDGAVLTSLVGRADCRVYGKPLRRGEGERHLSDEENRAIAAAARPGDPTP